VRHIRSRHAQVVLSPGAHRRDHPPMSRTPAAILHKRESDAAPPAADAARPQPAGGTSARRSTGRLVALIVASALFMEQLDSTVLATALPTMARSFNIEPLHMNVALTSYLLSLAVFIPASGTVADRYGSRTVFRAAIAIFTIGSILCGQANSLSFLVASRILQGIGGAMMVPVGRLVLLRSVSKADLVTAMAWLLIPATIGPVVGPPLGGFIVTYLTWRWIFYLNVPVGVLGVILVSRYIEEIRESRPARFDTRGFIFSGVALSCLMFGLELASRGVGSVILAGGLVAVGLVSGTLYLLHMRRCDAPILDFRLMSIATFRISVYAGSLTRIAVGAVPFLLPMMLQLGFGLSPAQSGMITFSSAAGSLLMRISAPRFLKRLGFRVVLTWIGLIAGSMLAVSAAFRPSWPVAWIYAVLLTGGFFQSLQFMAYNTIAYADVPRERMSAATSFYTTFQQMCLTLGIATSAAALAGSMALRGHTHALLPDFSTAFVVVAIIGLLGPLMASRLPRDAGSELSGHHPRVRVTGEVRPPIHWREILVHGRHPLARFARRQRARARVRARLRDKSRAARSVS
jgi:EmrB/QacA subfamily drug resistance transporter